MVTSYPPIPSNRPATVSIIPSAESRWEVVGHYFLVLFFSVTGTLLCWTGHNVMHMNPVVSSCLIGLMAFCVYPRYSPPAWAGSFAGMATTVVIPEAYWTLVLSAFAFSFFAIFDRFGILQGIGGRLGTTAFISCLLMIPVLLWVVPGYQHTFWEPERFNQIDYIFGLSAVGISTVTSIATILIRNHVKTLEHPVPSAAIISLLCAFILLPLNYPLKEDLLLFAYIGVSVGMSGRDVVIGYPTFVFLGAVTGCLGLAFYGLSTGDSGGKAGLTAMVGVALWVYIWMPIWRRVKDYICPCLASSSYSSFTVTGRRKSILNDLEEPVLLSQSPYNVWGNKGRQADDRSIENSIRGRLAQQDDVEDATSLMQLNQVRERSETNGSREMMSSAGTSFTERSLRGQRTPVEEEDEEGGSYYYEDDEDHLTTRGRGKSLAAMSVEENVEVCIDSSQRGI